MPRRLVLLVSVAANMFLAFAVAHLVITRFAPVPEKLSVITKLMTNVSRRIAEPTPPAVTNSSPPAAFRWRMIESADYRVYIANLRGVHCPEKTLRNIVIPDLEELYDKRRRDELQPAATNFWVSGRARAALNREHIRKETALDEEETALVKQLLGVDWVRQPRRSGNFLNEFETIAMPYLMTTSLPIEKAKDFGGVLQKYQNAAQRIQSEAEYILLPDDERKLRDLRTQLKADLARLVPTGELEEMMLRTTQMEGHNLFEALKDSPLTLSPEELRKISGLEVALVEAQGHDIFDRILHLTGRNDGWDENSEPTPQERKQLEQAISALLGDARYALFQEATDDAFKSAKSFVEQEHLSMATSRALFEIQKAAEDHAEEIRASQSLSAAEKRQSLRQARATTEAAIDEAINAKLMEKYRQINDGWLNNISKTAK